MGLSVCQHLSAGMVCAALSVGPCHAAHPLQTEDTGTQGTGKVELENGLSWVRVAGSKAFVYQPQLSYGPSPTLDLILQPSWLTVRDAQGPTTRGWGDTNLDAKWRFFDSHPWSLAVRAGWQLPTSQHGLGLPHGEAASHVLLVTTLDAAPFMFHGNVGYARYPASSGQRTDTGHVSGAVMWAASPRLSFTADAGADSNPSPAARAWPAYLLVGAICTIAPGLDADIGYQHVHTEQPSRNWLIGLTYRFGL
jgi:hypothetical protein